VVKFFAADLLHETIPNPTDTLTPIGGLWILNENGCPLPAAVFIIYEIMYNILESLHSKALGAGRVHLSVLREKKMKGTV
jgi:hypothetical protein